MRDVYDVTSLVVAASALVAGALAFAVTWRLRTGLGVLLDLLLAAGLLRLAAQPTWTGIATAAAIVAVRKLVGFGLAQVEHTRTG